jgi:hypothetical protein
VAAKVAAALDIGLGDGGPEQLAATIGTQRILVLLDNCEHVIEAAGRACRFSRRAASGCASPVKQSTGWPCSRRRRLSLMTSPFVARWRVRLEEGRRAFDEESCCAFICASLRKLRER